MPQDKHSERLQLGNLPFSVYSCMPNLHSLASAAYCFASYHVRSVYLHVPMTASMSPSHMNHGLRGSQSHTTRTSLNQYPRLKISQLKPGPVQAYFSGLVLNLQCHVPESPSPNGAKACVKLILRDETDEILVADTPRLAKMTPLYSNANDACILPGQCMVP